MSVCFSDCCSLHHLCLCVSGIAGVFTICVCVFQGLLISSPSMSVCFSDCWCLHHLCLCVSGIAVVFTICVCVSGIADVFTICVCVFQGLLMSSPFVFVCFRDCWCLHHLLQLCLQCCSHQPRWQRPHRPQVSTSSFSRLIELLYLTYKYT